MYLIIFDSDFKFKSSFKKRSQSLYFDVLYQMHLVLNAIGTIEVLCSLLKKS